MKRALARWYLADLDRRRRRHPPLAGDCGGCARCCERPAIAVGFLFHLPILRGIWRWWQRVVNGFVVVDRDREARAFIFSCTNFDPSSRRCDSYDSRPGMCRDYPRLLLEHPDSEFFEGCGYRARARMADGLLAALSTSGGTRVSMSRSAAASNSHPFGGRMFRTFIGRRPMNESAFGR